MKTITIPERMKPFELIINGKKYSYPAGTIQEVPDEVATVIENSEMRIPKPVMIGGGKHVDMAQNDPTKPDYVKNRTHYDSRVTDEIKITFDGNLDGKEHIKFSDTTWLVKASEHVPTTEEFMGSKVVIAAGQPGAIEHAQMEELLEPEDMGNGLYFFEPYAMFATKDISLEGIALTKGTWIYFRMLDDGSLEYISELSYTGTTGELKKLDDKYLPENDLVISYGMSTPEIVSGSVDAVLQKLCNLSGLPPYPKVTIIGYSTEDGGITFRQYAVTGLSGFKENDGSGRLYIHFMYFELGSGMSEERILVFSADGQHEDTITNGGAPG